MVNGEWWMVDGGWCVVKRLATRHPLFTTHHPRSTTQPQPCLIRLHHIRMTVGGPCSPSCHLYASVPFAHLRPASTLGCRFKRSPLGLDPQPPRPRRTALHRSARPLRHHATVDPEGRRVPRRDRPAAQGDRHPH